MCSNLYQRGQASFDKPICAIPQDIPYRWHPDSQTKDFHGWFLKIIACPELQTRFDSLTHQSQFYRREYRCNKLFLTTDDTSPPTTLPTWFFRNPKVRQMQSYRLFSC